MDEQQEAVQNLIGYIETCVRAGQTKDLIKKSLLATGWQEGMIDPYLNVSTPTPLRHDNFSQPDLNQNESEVQTINQPQTSEPAVSPANPAGAVPVQIKTMLAAQSIPVQTDKLNPSTNLPRLTYQKLKLPLFMLCTVGVLLIGAYLVITFLIKSEAIVLPIFMPVTGFILIFIPIVILFWLKQKQTHLSEANPAITSQPFFSEKPKI